MATRTRLFSKQHFYISISLWWTVLFCAGLIGCSTSTSNTAPMHPLETVQTVLSQVQMGQIGPQISGVLATGETVSHPINLDPDHCFAVVAVADSGLHDIDVAISDSESNVISQDIMDGPIAMAQFCPIKGGDHTVSVRADKGSGTYSFALWSTLSPDRDASLLLPDAGNGTCQNPHLLPLDTIRKGSTRNAESILSSTCSDAEGPEMVYAVDITTRSILSISLNAKFDWAVSVSKTCGDLSEVELCARDRRRNHSLTTSALEPGRYYVIVDGDDSNDFGEFVIRATAVEQPTAEAACTNNTKPLKMGETAGTTQGGTSIFRGSCSSRENAVERLYSLTIETQSRFRIKPSSAFDTLVYLRDTCSDETSERFCVEDRSATALLPPGQYTVFVDGEDNTDVGNFTLNADWIPVNQSTAPHDTLETAKVLDVAVSRTLNIESDTFNARDDLSGSCGGTGSPDVVYTFELTDQTKFIVAGQSREYDPVYYILKRDKTGGTHEVACQNSRKTSAYTLDAGSYYLVVDGESESTFGESTIRIESKNLVAAKNACKRATALKMGKSKSSRLGNTDNFSAERGAGQGGRDQVFKFNIKRPTHTTIRLDATFDGFLYLRKGCMDSTDIEFNDDHGGAQTSLIEQPLEAGTYYVVVDSRSRDLKNDRFSIVVESK